MFRPCSSRPCAHVASTLRGIPLPTRLFPTLFLPVGPLRRAGPFLPLSALPLPPPSVRTLHNALQFAGTLHNTHLVHPLRLCPAVSHAELPLLSSSLWPPAATIAPIRVPGWRYMARKMHYTVRCNPLPITCYPVFPASSPSPPRCSHCSTYPTRSVRLTFSLRWPTLPCFPFRCAHGASNLQGTCPPRCSAAPLAPCCVLWPHSAPRSLRLYAHGAEQCARQPLSHCFALSLPAPAPWVPPVPWSPLSPRLTYPCPPLFNSPRSTRHITMQPHVPNIAQRAWVSPASRYAAKVVGPADNPAASQP